MKKVFSFVMIAVLALTCMVMPAFAAETATTVSVETETVAIGAETVTLDVTVSEATFATYGMKVVYDTTALELTEIKQGEATVGLFSADETSCMVGAINATDSTVSGVLFTLTFKVLTDVKGTYPVTVEVDNVTKADLTAVEVATEAGAVVVECAHEWEWVIDKEATQDETGLKHEECKICGETRSEGTVIPKVPNTGDTTVVAALLAVVAFGVLATGVTVSKRKLFN